MLDEQLFALPIPVLLFLVTAPASRPSGYANSPTTRNARSFYAPWCAPNATLPRLADLLVLTRPTRYSLLDKLALRNTR